MAGSGLVVLHRSRPAFVMLNFVSASRVETAERVEDWTLNQVQGDDRVSASRISVL